MQGLKKLNPGKCVGLLAGLGGGLTFIAPACLHGGGALLGRLISDDDLEKASILIEGLKNLTPEEREQFFVLSKKISMTDS